MGFEGYDKNDIPQTKHFLVYDLYQIDFKNLLSDQAKENLNETQIAKIQSKFYEIVQEIHTADPHNKQKVTSDSMFRAVFTSVVEKATKFLSSLIPCKRKRKNNKKNNLVKIKSQLQIQKKDPYTICSSFAMSKFIEALIKLNEWAETQQDLTTFCEIPHVNTFQVNIETSPIIELPISPNFNLESCTPCNFIKILSEKKVIQKIDLFNEFVQYTSNEKPKNGEKPNFLKRIFCCKRKQKTDLLQTAELKLQLGALSQIFEL